MSGQYHPNSVQAMEKIRRGHMTDIQVGDDTRSFFPVTIWQKQLASTLLAGDVILLQNVKITRVGGLVEARTVQCSTLQCVVHSYKSLASKGADDLMRSCRIGTAARKSLKIVTWLQQGAAVELKNHQSALSDQTLATRPAEGVLVLKIWIS
ncbi:hypothetical protein HAX54_047107 [Datura stramonium]|uniref:Uncharacterized protein n=1 Tax=Datura stramonium TaxID=4076 RepID=A0ABS8SSH8_DATST|nr:hypothetical protein [Datura stramonium]